MTYHQKNQVGFLYRLSNTVQTIGVNNNPRSFVRTLFERITGRLLRLFAQASLLSHRLINLSLDYHIFWMLMDSSSSTKSSLFLLISVLDLSSFTWSWNFIHKTLRFSGNHNVRSRFVFENWWNWNLKSWLWTSKTCLITVPPRITAKLWIQDVLENMCILEWNKSLPTVVLVKSSSINHHDRNTMFKPSFFTYFLRTEFCWAMRRSSKYFLQTVVRMPVSEEVLRKYWADFKNEWFTTRVLCLTNLHLSE